MLPIKVSMKHEDNNNLFSLMLFAAYSFLYGYGSGYGMPGYGYNPYMNGLNSFGLGMYNAYGLGYGSLLGRNNLIGGGLLNNGNTNIYGNMRSPYGKTSAAKRFSSGLF